MMDMVERVAKELQDFFGCTPERAAIAARAAIEAMRPMLTPEALRDLDHAPNERR